MLQSGELVFIEVRYLKVVLFQEKLASLKQLHLEDLKAQTIAQKAALGSFRTSVEQTKRHELELLAQAHQNALELARQQVEQTYCAEIDTLKQENERELMSVRVELERALEIAQGREREAEIRQDEHQQYMRLKQR